jgi:putative transcriptional regulator
MTQATASAAPRVAAPGADPVQATGKGRVVPAIREWRAARGLTQQELADLALATRQTIIAIEAGKYAPSLDLAFRIARALRTPFEEVFRFEP